MTKLDFVYLVDEANGQWLAMLVHYKKLKKGFPEYIETNLFLYYYGFLSVVCYDFVADDKKNKINVMILMKKTWSK